MDCLLLGRGQHKNNSERSSYLFWWKMEIQDQNMEVISPNISDFPELVELLENFIIVDVDSEGFPEFDV